MSAHTARMRNPELVGQLLPDFASRGEFCGDGARLLSAVLAAHRDGGGRLRWGWMADSPQIFGAGCATVLTENNVTDADYAATANGGPYVDLDGATEWFDGGDVAWAEIGAEEFLAHQ